MIFVYRRANSDSAKELVTALEGIRVRGVQDGKFVRRFRPEVRTIKPHRGDSVICWGEGLADMPRLKILNGSPVASKFDQAQRLRQAGVPTIEVSRTRQAAPATNLTFDINTRLGHAVTQMQTREQLQQLITAFQRMLAEPVVQPATWLPRSNNHVGGADLLHPPAMPDYWSKKENLAEEYRIHMFQGKSIRAGKKAPRQGYVNPNPWIRSYDAGWFIDYNGFKSKKEMRELAAAACETLDLDFGAVDIGKKSDGSLVILEVNRAPGLEGNTVTVYTDAINRWLDGDTTEREAA